jgi:hypothetical protein
MKPIPETEVNGVANITADNCMEFQHDIYDAETIATTRSVTNMDCIVSKMEREIYSTTSNEQMHFRKQLPMDFISGMQIGWEATHNLPRLFSQHHLCF